MEVSVCVCVCVCVCTEMTGKCCKLIEKNRTRKEIIRKALTVPQSSAPARDLIYSQQWC